MNSATTDALHIDALGASIAAWRLRISKLKQTNPPKGYTWYGYDILANVDHLSALLSAPNRDVFSRVRGQPIADIGTADGDLAYFLEDQGFDVDLIDWPATNWNSLRGARRLKELLGSRAAIHEIDLDSQFSLPRKDYGLVVFLGILYHLKNPYFALERLAESTRYCLLSTRVARFTADGALDLGKAPLAYLLGPDECNNDATNFWIFSVPGLQRLADRTGWWVRDLITLGDTTESDPSSPQHDERAFMLLESKRYA